VGAAGHRDLMSFHRWSLVCPPPKSQVVPARVDPEGETGPTKRQASGSGWRQTSSGFYVPAATPTDVPEQRILEQSMRLPELGAVTGWAACRLRGGNFFDGLARDGITELPVPLALGRRGHIRADDRVQLSYNHLSPDEIEMSNGIRVVTRERGVFDAMRFAQNVREAVVAAEMAVGAWITSFERMRVYAVAHAGWEGIIQVREALTLGREHARSPNEVRLRMTLELDAGLPPPLINCPVYDLHGRLLGIADLLDPIAGLVVEFDGADHRGKARHNRDLAKDEALRGVGLEVTRVSGDDLNDSELVVGRVQGARSRCHFEPADRRRWEARPVPDRAEQEIREREELAAFYAEIGRQALAIPS